MKRQPPPAEFQQSILEAESSYICDPERRPVEYWHQEFLERYQKELDWTRRYALDNRWAERRQSFWRGVQAAWLRQQQMALLQTRAQELMEAQELRTQIFTMIKPKMVNGIMTTSIQPKSYEGMVRTFIQLDDLIEGKRDAVLATVDPMLGRTEAEMQDDHQKPQLPFSGDEMRHLAHNLLGARRRKRRAEMLIEENDGSATVEPGTEESDGGVEGEDGPGGHERSGELDSGARTT